MLILIQWAAKSFGWFSKNNELFICKLDWHNAYSQNLCDFDSNYEPMIDYSKLGNICNDNCYESKQLSMLNSIHMSG